MPTTSSFKSALFAAAALVAVAVSASAHAAVVPPFHDAPTVQSTSAIPVYWVWRHHHRVWIPMHHHGY